MSNTPAVSSGAHASLSHEIYQSLGADKSDLDNLNLLLAAERVALEAREHQAINDFAEQKAVIVKRMEQRNELRTTLLRRHHLASNAESWKQTINKLDESTSIKLMPLWLEIEAQLEDCRQKLMINERIVGGMKQSVDRFMNILRGQTGSGQTYNATGRAENFSSNKPFTSA